MVKITVRVDGMMCGMCESHINEVVRKKLPVKKVKSSRGRGETVILAEAGIAEEALREAITGAGYGFKGATSEPYAKKGLLGFGS